eukprot:1699705-Rhodomonas_salina.1
MSREAFTVEKQMALRQAIAKGLLRGDLELDVEQVAIVGVEEADAEDNGAGMRRVLAASAIVVETETQLTDDVGEEDVGEASEVTAG